MILWKSLFSPASPDIGATNASAYAYGEVAFVMCYELINDGVLIAANIFALQDGLWKMVHHQAGATMGLPQQSADKAI